MTIFSQHGSIGNDSVNKFHVGSFSQEQIDDIAARLPVREVRVIVNDSGQSYTNRLFVGTPATGNVRIEWVAARYNQLLPINWSMGTLMQVMGGYYPLRYQVADAQNLIVAEAMRLDYEYLLLHEHDVLLPVDAFVKLNRYMLDKSAPVVSGLYFSRSYPSDPMVFKTLGDSYATDWRLGDVVEVAAVPTGIVLIHMGLIRAMWPDCEEYTIKGVKVRRVFNTPRESYYNPETGEYSGGSMTSDLDRCRRVVAGGYLLKAGWGDYVDKHPEYQFLVDTSICCFHCNPDGQMFPDKARLAEFGG